MRIIDKSTGNRPDRRLSETPQSETSRSKRPLTSQLRPMTKRRTFAELKARSTDGHSSHSQSLPSDSETIYGSTREQDSVTSSKPESRPESRSKAEAETPARASNLATRPTRRGRPSLGVGRPSAVPYKDSVASTSAPPGQPNGRRCDTCSILQRRCTGFTGLDGMPCETCIKRKQTCVTELPVRLYELSQREKLALQRSSDEGAKLFFASPVVDDEAEPTSKCAEIQPFESVFRIRTLATLRTGEAHSQPALPRHGSVTSAEEPKRVWLDYNSMPAGPPVLADPANNIVKDPIMTPAYPGIALDDNGSSVNAGHYEPTFIMDGNAVALPQPCFDPWNHWANPYELATHDGWGLVPGREGCQHSLITQDDFNEGHLDLLPYSSTMWLHEPAEQFRNDTTQPLPNEAAQPQETDISAPQYISMTDIDQLIAESIAKSMSADASQAHSSEAYNHHTLTRQYDPGESQASFVPDHFRPFPHELPYQPPSYRAQHLSHQAAPTRTTETSACTAPQLTFPWNFYRLRAPLWSKINSRTS